MTRTEMLAVYDHTGRRIGTKSREDVHRDHDWHTIAFVWVAWVDANGRRRFLLQFRGGRGDPFRGHVDAPAGGHVAADENHLEGALRECREEMGFILGPDDLIHLGQRFMECPTGICRHAIQQLYLCRRPVRLEELRATEEVGGFVEVEMDAFAALLDGRRSRVDGRSMGADGTGRIRSIAITREHLAAYSMEVLESFRYAIRAIGRCLDRREPSES